MPNGVQKIYSKTGIISKYLLHKTYRYAKLYSKIWALTEKTLPLHPRLSYGVMVALQFLVLSVVVRIRLGQHRNPRIHIESADFLFMKENLNYSIYALPST